MNYKIVIIAGVILVTLINEIAPKTHIDISDFRIGIRPEINVMYNDHIHSGHSFINNYGQNSSLTADGTNFNGFQFK